MSKRLVAVPLALIVGAGVLAAAPAGASGQAADGAVTVTPAERIAKLTGPQSINDTENRFGLKATDLGILWDNGAGQILTAFGDSYGAGWTGPGGGQGDQATIDWRCNLLFRSADKNLADGMTLDSAAEDRPGHAKQVLDCKKIDRDEHTVIPTAGISVGKRQYLHYMSVSHWGPAGSWFTKYSGIAYSDDNGENWTKHPTARWQNDASWSDNFQMAAFVRHGGYVYMYGTKNGRFGNAQVARVPEGKVLTKSAYRYWDGRGWTSRQAAAVPVVVGPVSEVSVQYHTGLGRWLMMYLDEHRAAVVLRSATSPTGPWSGEQVVAKGTDFPGLYGTYLHPWSTGSDLYFVMSQWDPYNVYLFRTKVALGTGGVNVVSDPGFEEQTSRNVAAPWQLSGRGGLDVASNTAHSGKNNAWVRDANGRHELQQTAAVRPGHRYRLTGWLRTAPEARETVLGARTLRGTTLAHRKTGALGDYTQLSVEFTAKEALVQLYAGAYLTGQDVWTQVDDLSLTEIR